MDGNGQNDVSGSSTAKILLSGRDIACLINQEALLVGIQFQGPHSPSSRSTRWCSSVRNISPQAHYRSVGLGVQPRSHACPAPPLTRARWTRALQTAAWNYGPPNNISSICSLAQRPYCERSISPVLLQALKMNVLHKLKNGSIGHENAQRRSEQRICGCFALPQPLVQREIKTEERTAMAARTRHSHRGGCCIPRPGAVARLPGSNHLPEPNQQGTMKGPEALRVTIGYTNR